MDLFVIALAAFLAAALTLVSGFGLGTLLMPVVSLFLPVNVAIGVTAVVHLVNNLVKLGLLGRHANWAVVVRFGLPAVLAAFLGAAALGWLSHLQPLAEYTLADRAFAVLPVKVVVGALILVFVMLDLSPAFGALTFDARLLPLGGCMSGFFGGLSGNQGAFRSMFLIKAGLTKEQFIATGVVLAVLVDLARTPIYVLQIARSEEAPNLPVIVIACLAAAAGSLLGARWLKKLTVRAVRLIVTVMLLGVALGLMAGLI